MGKEERQKSGLYPSRDVDVAVALELLSWSWYRFARSTEKLAVSEIRAVLEALEATDERPVAGVFLRSAVDASSDALLAKTWAAAVNAMKVFESQYAWGSKPKREKLTAISKSPVLLAATQAAVVRAASLPVRDELLAVLVLDAREASLDALMPHFEAAMADRQRLSAMLPLEKYARRTPELKVLFARVHAALKALAERSPVAALGQQLGLGDFRAQVSLDSTDDTAYCRLTLEPEGFELMLTRGTKATRFTDARLDEDELRLGRCELAEAPQWLETSARALKFKWHFSAASVRHLRGKRLTTLMAWLSKP